MYDLLHPPARPHRHGDMTFKTMMLRRSHLFKAKRRVSPRRREKQRAAAPRGRVTAYAAGCWLVRRPGTPFRDDVLEPRASAAGSGARTRGDKRLGPLPIAKRLCA